MPVLIIMFLFIVWLLASVYVGVLASRKGRVAIIFFLAALFFSPVIGLLLVAIESPNVEVLKGRRK